MQRLLCDDGIDVVTSAETLRVHGRSGEDVGIIIGSLEHGIFSL
jgi:hypothetical protein